MLDPDATVSRTIDLPAGATGGTTIFGPDGIPYQAFQYLDSLGRVESEQIVALSTGTFTPVVPAGFLTYGIPNIQFSPDGTGYLITNADGAGIRITAFDADGATGAALTLTNPVVRDNNSFDTQALVFAPDGTAYAVANGSRLHGHRRRRRHRVPNHLGVQQRQHLRHHRHTDHTPTNLS